MKRTAAWLGTVEAAAILGVRELTLRRSLERNARRLTDGSIVAKIDGVVARRFGRRWRVMLDALWLEPTERTRAS
jgi:hypothetical protein